MNILGPCRCMLPVCQVPLPPPHTLQFGNTNTHAHTCTGTGTRTHTCRHTHTHTRTLSHTHTRTHARTQTLSVSLSLCAITVCVHRYLHTNTGTQDYTLTCKHTYYMRSLNTYIFMHACYTASAGEEWHELEFNSRYSNSHCKVTGRILLDIQVHTVQPS